MRIERGLPTQRRGFLRAEIVLVRPALIFGGGEPVDVIEAHQVSHAVPIVNELFYAPSRRIAPVLAMIRTAQLDEVPIRPEPTAPVVGPFHQQLIWPEFQHIPESLGARLPGQMRRISVELHRRSE